MMERNLSSSVQSAMRLSVSMANADNHTSYGISHLVLALLSEGTGTGLSNILTSMNKDVGYIQEWFEYAVRCTCQRSMKGMVLSQTAK